MKKISFILTMLIILSGCSEIKVKYFDFTIQKLKRYSISEEKKIPKTRIIVGNFYNYSRFGTNESDTIARNLLIEKLKNNNNFLIIEDFGKNEFIEKLAFLEPRDKSFIRLKRNYLDVDYIIIGSLLDYNWETTRQKNIVYDLNLEKTSVQLELKVINMITGEIWTKTDSGTAHLTTSSSGNRFDTSDFFYEKLEKTTLEKAIENGADKVIKAIESLPWSAVVLEKNENDLVIDMHQDKILSKGTEFEVYEQKDLISYKDKVLGYEEKLVGTAKLVSYENEGKAILRYKGVDFLPPAVVKLK